MRFIDLGGVSSAVHDDDEFQTLLSRGRPYLVVVHGQCGIAVHLLQGIASVTFSSRDVLKDTLSGWQSLYGVRLAVEGKVLGQIGKKLPEGI